MGSLDEHHAYDTRTGQRFHGDMDENKFKKIEAIIFSMTRHERKNAKILNSGRRKRIAKGSGTPLPMLIDWSISLIR